MIMDKTSTSRSMDPPVEDKVERVIFCSGKVYYDLDESREERRNSAVKICRIEQLGRVLGSVGRELKRYPNAEVVWCQEEPMNMGAWFHVQPRMSTLFKHLSRPGRCARRSPSSRVPRHGSPPFTPKSKRRSSTTPSTESIEETKMYKPHARPSVHPRATRTSISRAPRLAGRSSHSPLSHDSSNPPTSSTRRTGLRMANPRLGGSSASHARARRHRAFARRRR